MKKLYFFLFISLSQFSFGQNLVPNPSFELYDTCPIDGRVSHCLSWVNCGNTPDYDNSCVPAGTYSVPSNVLGYQFAATGNAYCDLKTMVSNTGYREFIGANLIQPMIISHNYYVSFKCSPGTRNGNSMQTNNLGIRFSTVSFDSINPPPINNFSNIYSSSIITDTSNWTIISGNFIADSTYSFLTIGNFFDDAHTDTIMPCFGCASSVYFIDDIYVSDTTTGINEINLHNSIKYFQTSNELTFYGTQMSQVEIFDCIGKKEIMVLSNNEDKINVDIGKLKIGFYVAIIKSNNQTISLKCIIN